MSIPYTCRICGDIIGTEPEMFTLGRIRTGNFNWSKDVNCPGRGKHPEPTRTTTKRFFGLIDQVTLYYPETNTSSTWGEYTGPPEKFWLWFVIVFGTKRNPNGTYAGVIVNGKWAWWDSRTGFYGDGVVELLKLQA
jgi:hypothetical protein